MSTYLQKIDIVIPVFNAIDYVERCVESILRYAPESINKIHLLDDSSTEETFSRLEKLQRENVEVYRSRINVGFGKTVNKGVAITTTELVLVLNSDTEAIDNFIKPLLKAMEDPNLLAATPVPKETKKFKPYEQSKGYVKSYILSGYAFIIRRQVFMDLGGFDEDFGRGYYEDGALARSLCSLDGFTGIVPSSILLHHGSKSFSSTEVRELKETNRAKFLAKFPASSKRILFYLKNVAYSSINEEIKCRCELVCREGGRVSLFSKQDNIPLPNSRFIKIRRGYIGFFLFIYRYIIRGKKRPLAKITEIWIGKDSHYGIKILFKYLGNKFNLHVVKI